MHPELATLLLRRIAVITDHGWRDRDPAGHLAALQEVSEAITDWTAANYAGLDARLRHYLTNSSFDKALAHLEQT